MPEDLSDCEPPDPISNSEVKMVSADGSVGSPHVRVGHPQALNRRTPSGQPGGVFYLLLIKSLSKFDRIFALS